MTDLAPPERVPNEGSRLLAEAMARAGISHRALAREKSERVPETPLHHGVVGAWLRARQKPDTANRVWLHERFGIPLLAWDEAPKTEAAE